MEKRNAVETERKLWWVVAIVVPLLVALIAIFPDIVRVQEEGHGSTPATSTEDSPALAEQRERFYWRQISRLTDMLEARLDERSDRLLFSRYFEGCRSPQDRLVSFRIYGDSTRSAGLQIKRTANDLVGMFRLKDLAENADQAFVTLDLLGKTLADEALTGRIYLIEVRSGQRGQNNEARVYTEVAADAIREYFVVKFGISRCRLIARGSEEVAETDTLMIKNYGRLE